MEKVKITALLWDGFNVKHIEKHRVEVSEIEKALRDKKGIFRETYKERLLVLGYSGKRLLATIVVKDKSTGLYYVITARDMDKKERQIYRKENHEKVKNQDTGI